MSATDTGFTVEIHGEADDLIADYEPDSSGRYRIFWMTDGEDRYLVTSINDVDQYAERAIRRADLDGFDWEGEGCMLTDRFGSCPDIGPDEIEGARVDNVVRIDGEAWALVWAEGVTMCGVLGADGEYVAFEG